MAPPFQVQPAQPQAPQHNASSTCPTGMALQNHSDPRFPHEPAFCIDVTEVPQDAYIASLPQPLQSSYVTLLKNTAKQLEGASLVGPKKPAVKVSAREADTYCASKYSQGATPTMSQWQIACGNKHYCTASGTLNPSEAVYGTAGPADVDFGSANANGVKNMTGNEWEWLRDVSVDGRRLATGGAWLSFLGSSDHPIPINRDPDYRSVEVGLRCVAPPQGASK